jgi:hypothetical protein
LNNNRRRLEEISIRSSLASLPNVTETDLAALRKQAWVEQGVFVVDLRYPGMSASERAFVENMGLKYYGKRRGNNGR